METFKHLLKIIIEWLSTFIESLGLPSSIANIENVLSILLILCTFLFSVFVFFKMMGFLIRKTYNYFYVLKKNKEFPYYSSNVVKGALTNYIRPKISIENKNNVIKGVNGKKYFLQHLTGDIPNEDKYYWILGSTGMGKTSFLINLCVALRNRFSSDLLHVFFPIRGKLYTELLPLHDEDVIDKIKKIKKKQKTILLLDAFDEDIKAVNNYQERFNEIINAIVGFKKVVISCRTQFFPTPNDILVKTPDPTYTENGMYWFKKIYLNSFSEKDVKTYLKRKYPLSLVNQKRKKAIKRVKQLNELDNNFSTPLILKYMDDLIDTNKHFNFQYYETIFDEWVNRESKKHKHDIKHERDFFVSI